MLDNSLQREGVKAGGTVLAITAGNPVAAGLAVALGVAVETLGVFGEKRSKELFNSKQFTDAVVVKIKQSDDFASFVLSVWQKHNLESSASRRAFLKNFLEKEAYSDSNDFENFSKLESIIQNVNLKALYLLKLIYSDVARNLERTRDSDLHIDLNLRELSHIANIGSARMREVHVENYMEELIGYGLVNVLRNRYDGPNYQRTRLGAVLLEYIQEGIS